MAAAVKDDLLLVEQCYFYLSPSTRKAQTGRIYETAMISVRSLTSSIFAVVQT